MIETYPQHDGDGNPTGQFGWRLRVEGNHATTAVGGEGFTSEEHARRAALSVAYAFHRLVDEGTVATTIKSVPL